MKNEYRKMVKNMGIPNKSPAWTGGGLLSQKSLSFFYKRLGKLKPEDLAKLYYADAIVAKMVDDLANESTKHWRKWSARPEMERLERDLEIKHHVNEAIKKARLFGGSILVMNALDGRSLSEELDFSSPFLQIASLQSLDQHALSETNDFSEGTPERVYFRNGEIVHSSRLCFFAGQDLSVSRSINKDSNHLLGASVVAPALKSLYDYNLTEYAITKMVEQPFVDVFHLDFEKYAKKGISPSEIKEAMNQLNLNKEEGVTLDIGDSYTSEYREFNTFVDLQVLQMKKIAGDLGIPLSRLFGQSVGGLSAGAMDEARKYYEKITDYQKNHLERSLAPLDRLLKAILYGENPNDAHYEWVSLWEMSEMEKIEMELKRANLVCSYLKEGVVSKEEARSYLMDNAAMKALLQKEPQAQDETPS